MRDRYFTKTIMNASAQYKLHVSVPWFTPLERPFKFIILGLLLIGLAMAGNNWVRHLQLASWQQATEQTHIRQAPLFSTADAPYFLRMARSIDGPDGTDAFQKIRLFPNLVDSPANEAENASLRAWPLLSVMLAYMSKERDIGTLLVLANTIIIVTAAATALMIAICFGAAGYWNEGAVAALGGGLNSAYLVRSSIGRIDTDQLNLGFMYLMFGLVVLAGRAKTRIQAIIWSVAAGLCANLFMWWYGKPELIAMAAIALVWLLCCLQRNILTVLAGTTVFLALSDIVFFKPLTSAYLKGVLSEASFIFPNTFQTITEIRQVSLLQVLINASGSVEMGIVCLAGLALFFIRHPIIAIAYGPLVAFGLLNFVIGNRAIFYSAPIMWFGAAFLMTTGARFVAANLSAAGYTTRRDQTATILAASVAMVVAWVNSPTDYVPRPSFPKTVLEGLASLKDSADPDNSVVATWWDYGYASMFFNELPTFHDGGTQTTPSTHFVATAFLDADQARSIGNLKFLSTKGHKGIAEQTTVAGLKAQFSEALNAPSPDLYFVVTGQMAGWMGSISTIGNWDIETGKPVTPRGNPNGPILDYQRLNCRLAGYPQSLTCGSATFDLERGLVNGAPVLAGWAHAQDGTLVRRQSFRHDGHLALQIVQTGNRISAFLMHRQLFESTFNELYHLGQIDHPSISLHYDDYPHIRIYKLEGTPAG